MISDLSLAYLLGLFALAGSAVVAASVRATALADIIADRTRLGEAMAGGVLLGGATSLSGVVVSVSAAAGGDASFAMSNAVGGIAAQTLFLAVADLLHRRVNLEHAAAEPANLFQAVMLLILLSMPIAAMAGPDIAYFGVSPVSVVMFLGYLWGVKLSSTVSDAPMWRPVETRDTRVDEPDADSNPGAPVTRPALIFAALVAVMGLSGWVISQVAGEFITRFDLSSSLVGALMTAVITSLPELVTTLVAVRLGALQLAVGGIIGGNTFDTLFLVFSDVAYRDGSIFQAASDADLYWLATGMLMTAILLGGLILRQREGPASIGIESVLLIAVYACAVAVALLA
ncbi:cation transporter [Salipiger aestuarii]|uniref:Cation:H+ antiporter n=1 Tax=Salipiger aestuarii TaxID=568098 RepID=A0A327XWT5_9RHOB|nr:cation transporter [Salipiger aestuarii]EIE50747.1 sodium/calcium exchanger membrane region [Citreicella sp. 357]KAA8606180.1 cation transporter [Salipiger aestuarii]KAA8614140.1 cation transporter [Salipiger aestuarii]KAB2540852.1 cation transporter [Salipiger aestuarii]RAK12366.1 cation:H+ antiporter [Salipiger aestuarii]